jgi:hypothetical protein
LGYLAYLLTGDRFYAEELSFWASFQMGEWPHQGLNWQGLDRAFAWSLRQVTDAAYILPETDPLQAYFAKGIAKCLDELTEKLVRSGRRVHSPPEGGWKVSGRYNWVNAMQCSSWQYAWVVWSLGNAADKGFDQARPVRDWAADYIMGPYTSPDEFTAPDGKVYRYDPRDAMSYSTAVQLLDTQLDARSGQKDIRVIRKLGDLENYGEIWYTTKLNEDNAWSQATGGPPEPNANGRWPLRANGWGGRIGLGRGRAEADPTIQLASLRGLGGPGDGPGSRRAQGGPSLADHASPGRPTGRVRYGNGAAPREHYPLNNTS